VPKVPSIARDLDRRIGRLTTGEYRRPEQLEPGGILVVGSAQSGCQIAEELVDAGREVSLATGNVGRTPRRMRGRDTLVWLTTSGWMDQRPADLPDPAMVRWAQPQISGVGPPGHTVSLQSLAARGVTLLGRLDGVAGTKMRFARDLAAHLRFGDETARRIRQHVDDHIARSGISAPASEADPADEPVADPDAFSGPNELDLSTRRITTVIFTTGFDADLVAAGARCGRWSRSAGPRWRAVSGGRALVPRPGVAPTAEVGDRVGRRRGQRPRRRSAHRADQGSAPGVTVLRGARVGPRFARLPSAPAG